MNISDELIKSEVEKIINEKMKECMNKIINDFNKENKEKNGVEIDEIKMENLHYVISIKGKKVNL
jgi:hypothetical protein